jgi:hypothetical protein
MYHEKNYAFEARKQYHKTIMLLEWENDIRKKLCLQGRKKIISCELCF